MVRKKSLTLPVFRFLKRALSMLTNNTYCNTLKMSDESLTKEPYAIRVSLSIRPAAESFTRSFTK